MEIPKEAGTEDEQDGRAYRNTDSGGLMDLWAEVGILDGGERLGRFIGRYREAYFTPAAMNPYTGVVYSYVPVRERRKRYMTSCPT